MANLKQQSIPAGMSYGEVLNYFDAMKEDIDKVQFFPFGDEYFDAANLILNGIGQREIAKQPQMSWFERQRQEVPFTVQGNTNIASGVYTVTIPSSEIDPTTGYSWPIPNEIYRYAPSGQLFQIIGKPAPNTLVLRPLKAATTISLANGAKFFFVGNSQPEGSDATQSKFIFSDKYTAYLQTMRNDVTTTSEAMFDQLWYSENEEGRAIPFSNSDNARYLQREHLMGMVNTFFTGEVADNLSASTSFQTTAGLIPTIFERGQTQSTSGTLDATDMYAMEEKLTGQDGGVKDYAIWLTGKSSASLEQSMLTYNQNVNIQLANTEMTRTFWGESALADKLSLSYSFKSLVFNSKNFALTRQGIWDNPQTFSVTGSNWKDYALVLPMAKGQGVNDGYGNMGKYIRITHKPDAFMNMWSTGGRANANRTPNWNFKMHIVSEVGFKFICANKMGLFYNT